MVGAHEAVLENFEHPSLDVLQLVAQGECAPEQNLNADLHRHVEDPAHSAILNGLERLTSSQLWVLSTAVAVGATEVIVSCMESLLKGEITNDYLLTGLVAALLVASAITALLLLLFDHRRLEAQQRQRLVRQLEQSEEHVRKIVMASRLALLDYDLVTGVVYLSEGWSQLLGAAQQSIVTTMPKLSRLIPTEEISAVREAIIGVLKGQSSAPCLITHRVRRFDGEYAWIQSEGRVVERSKDGRALRLMGTSHDITEIKKAEDEMRVAASAFETSEGIMVTDAQGIILRVNEAFTKITGYAPEEMYGRRPSILKSDRQPSEFFREMWDAIRRDGRWAGEIWNRRKHGDVYPEWLRINAVRDRQGLVTHYVGTFTDISSQKHSEASIYQLAYYDQLTELPNRRLLLDRLGEVQRKSEQDGQFGAILFLDLDNFKTINDTMGHGLGDMLLVDASRRIRASVRNTDTVSRFGGDEFIVLLYGLGDKEEQAVAQAAGVGDKLINILAKPYDLNGKAVTCTVSIGMNLFKGRGQGWNELLRQSDVAMYSAKKAGRNTHCFFDLNMQLAIEARVRLERELRNAVLADEFVILFQKRVDNKDQIDGAEVLLRWQHPERGLISPQEFIHLAEETGLIAPIGQWVTRKACQQLKEWEGRDETKHLMLSVNISAKEFKNKDFVESMRNVLAETGANPGLLELEITESMLLDDIHDCIRTMRALKAIGVTLALDDFGTGYSSLAYLKELPIDTLKIDQSFIRDLGRDDNDDVIVQTIIQMGQNLGLNVIAEGVESLLQRAILEACGCLHYQGYLFGRPEAISALEFNSRKRDN